MSAIPGVRLLPREHGTWAMLIVPWMIGCGVAGRLSLDSALLLGALVAFFLAHAQLMTWWRLRRSSRPGAPALQRSGHTVIALSVVGLLAGAPLLLGDRRGGILALGALGAALGLGALWLISRREERALPGQALAAIGLTLSAPAAWYVITGTLGHVAVALWLLNMAYFLGAAAHVRMLIAARRRKTPAAPLGRRLAFAMPTATVLVILLAVAAAALRLGGFSSAGLLGFVPLLLQFVVDTVRLDRPPPLKRVGLLATVSSMLFALFVISLA